MAKRKRITPLQRARQAASRVNALQAVSGYERKIAGKREAGVKAAPAAVAAPAGGQDVKAPVPGTVLRVSVTNGQKVAKGDELLVMDVMKMETPVAAPCDGTVTVMIAATDKVATGDTLAVIG